MIIYKNRTAAEGEIMELSICIEYTNGKKLYNAECVYMRHSIAPNGDTHDKAMFSTYVSKEQHNKQYLLNYFKGRILSE